MEDHEKCDLIIDGFSPDHKLISNFLNLCRPNPSDPDPDRADVRGRLQKQLNGAKLGEVLEQLRRSPAGLDQNLKKAIGFATAYHHAGESHCLFSLSLSGRIQDCPKQLPLRNGVSSRNYTQKGNVEVKISWKFQVPPFFVSLEHNLTSITVSSTFLSNFDILPQG